ncbi:MAG TPA: serine hydrolase domain-containing protein [Gemmatimonadales bacterium]|nr:serine hydrolase domain-containing protein [Gemmatimonadales bacterium]
MRSSVIGFTDRSHQRVRSLPSIILALSPVFAVGVAHAQAPVAVRTTVAPDTIFQATRAEIMGLVEAGEIPSMVVAVARGGTIIWEEAFGWADRESEIAATPGTVYPVGSLSKSITATGIMVLVERGVIGLDDPVTAFLPESTLKVYEGDREAVTIRRVLNMSAGIPHGWANYGNAFAPPKIQEYLADAGIVVFPPGAEQLYSNNAYGVLEAVIAAASGRDFAEFIESEVFGPLGMSGSSARLTPDLLATAASRYGTDRLRLTHDQSEFVPLGGAGMYASVHDLIRYGMFHLKNSVPDQEPVLSDEALDRMHFTKDPRHPDGIIAMGWGSVELESGHRWLISNGSIGGANSMLTLLPDDDLAVAVLTNFTSSSLADETAVRIADGAVPGFAEGVGRFIGAFEAARAPRPFEPNSALIGSWGGVLLNRGTEIPVLLSILHDGSMMVQVAAQSKVQIGEATTRGDNIEADFRGRIPGHQHFGQDHDMHLTLRHDGERLYGFLSSRTETEFGSLSIPFYVRLTKAKP